MLLRGRALLILCDPEGAKNNETEKNPQNIMACQVAPLMSNIQCKNKQIKVLWTNA